MEKVDRLTYEQKLAQFIVGLNRLAEGFETMSISTNKCTIALDEFTKSYRSLDLI